MEYYCIMVRTGGEEAFKADLASRIKEIAPDAEIYFFKRKLRTSAGEVYIKPLFEGYIFIGAENLPAVKEQARKCINFFHFLNSNTDVQALRGQDLAYLKMLVQAGETQGFSRAKFDVNQRIVVTSGPLTGFAGNIIRVNRRRQRVTVRLEMCGSISTFDMAYDLVQEDAAPPQTQKKSS